MHFLESLVATIEVLHPLFPVYSPPFSMTSPDGIAVCLSCGNEWTVREPGVKKKRKCPVCGKYRIKLKSEVLAESKESGGSNGDNDNGSGRDRGGASGGGSPPDSGGGLDTSVSRSPAPGVGAAPAAKVVSRKIDPEVNREKGEENEGNTGGGSGWLILAGLIGLGVLAGSFLMGSSVKRPAPPALQERKPIINYPKSRRY